ncbi:ABC-type transport auxiliary lipoprotein family protein [Fundidesulfovibrio agrisoli]|uniref:ABC-type transport auxiliary lipoprotein family protein n=1 Tax=Fundidesulfovibrio agrisoli TaxID=2922717 RepID=UPI001FAE744B|nr:ABC-type transport auxiliary lipoprotein family protein [Fundidesulfovibrio agrisoli]
MKRHPLMWLVLLAALSGCMGKPGPAEQYLRVLGPEPDCARASQPQAGAARMPVLAVRPFKALDALDRQGVMIAEGKVMQASQRWYWEASPGRLVEQSVVRAACGEGLAAAWPVRSTTEASVWVSGLVSDFSVHTREMRVVLSVECQLWDASGGVALGSGTFTAQAPVAALDAGAVAEAGEKALNDVSARIAQWARQSLPAGSKAGK